MRIVKKNQVPPNHPPNLKDDHATMRPRTLPTVAATATKNMTTTIACRPARWAPVGLNTLIHIACVGEGCRGGVRGRGKAGVGGKGLVVPRPSSHAQQASAAVP